MSNAHLCIPTKKAKVSTYLAGIWRMTPQRVKANILSRLRYLCQIRSDLIGSNETVKLSNTLVENTTIYGIQINLHRYAGHLFIYKL